MSLVGTRPPTVDEWELYEPQHRANLTYRFTQKRFHVIIISSRVLII